MSSISQSSGEFRRSTATWDLNHTRERKQAATLVRQLSRWMDNAFELPIVGWRFGWDPIVGLIPGLGDVATTLVSLYIIALSARAGVPRVTLARMGLNVALDMLLGSLPIVGDLADVWWKANQRNAALFEARVPVLGENRRASAGDWLFVTGMLVGLIVLLVAIVALMALVVAALYRAVFG
jgi:hypothetical protein